MPTWKKRSGKLFEFICLRGCIQVGVRTTTCGYFVRSSGHPKHRISILLTIYSPP
jgi:hypothetical protein